MQQATAAAGKAGARGAPAIQSSQVSDAGEQGVRVIEYGAIDRALWESNILFGKSRLDEVRKISSEAQSKGLESGFLIHLALCRLEGNKQAFEDMAVEYAVQTGNSPPVWLDAHDPKEAAYAVKQETKVTVGSLTSDGIIETTIKMETPWELILDFSVVTKIDSMGLEILQQALQERIDRGEVTKLIRADRVLRHIVPKLKDAVESSATLWQFCFNCMRLTGTRDKFDELAADYVEKTGGDMPTWIDLSGKAAEAEAESVKQAFVGYALKETVGELSTALVKELLSKPEYAKLMKGEGPFVIDFTQVRRWTPEEMPQVIDFIRQFAKINVMLQFVNVNELLLALMKAFGLDKQVQLRLAGEIA